jgi:hypothetical protein
MKLEDHLHVLRASSSNDKQSKQKKVHEFEYGSENPITLPTFSYYKKYDRSYKKLQRTTETCSENKRNRKVFPTCVPQYEFNVLATKDTKPAISG